MRSPLRFATLALLLPLALTAAACGGDGDDDATSATATAAAATTASSEAATDDSGTTAAADASGETEASASASDEQPTTTDGGTGTAADATATGGETATEPTETESRALNVPTGPDGCTHVEPPTAGGERRTYDGPPSSGLADGATATVQFDTSCGVIRISLDPEVGGVVTDSFAGLVRDGFYDGLTFHRVVPDFVLQGGDPEGDGSGGPGYEVMQPPPESYVYARGDVAMAKLQTDPAGTAGSQFFIVVSPQGAAALGQPGEPPLYAVVGHILDEESVQTVNRIAALGVGDGPPIEPVWIWQATLEQE